MCVLCRNKDFEWVKRVIVSVNLTHCGLLWSKVVNLQEEHTALFEQKVRVEQFDSLFQPYCSFQSVSLSIHLSLTPLVSLYSLARSLAHCTRLCLFSSICTLLLLLLLLKLKLELKLLVLMRKFGPKKQVADY